MDIYRNHMVGSVNKVILLGRLGKDPEIRSMQSGKKVANFGIATSKRWKDRETQEQKESTTWHNIVVFNEGLVGIIEQYVKKGSQIYIEGELQTRKWQDKDGNDRLTTEVVLQPYNSNLTLLGGRNNSQTNSDNSERIEQNGDSSDNSFESQTSDSEDLDEDIPF